MLGQMSSKQGTFEWFRDVVGLSGEGIVLRHTHPHRCGGEHLTRNLHNSHATVQNCNVLFGGRSSHNGFKLRGHQNECLRIYVRELFRRVHQIDDSPNHDISRTFARGVFAEVKRDFKVNWAAFAVVTCHWGRRIFVLHSFWASVDAAPAINLEGLLFACKKSVGKSQVDCENERYLDVHSRKVHEDAAVATGDCTSLVLGKAIAGVFDKPISNFIEASPSHAQEDMEMSLPGTAHLFQSPILKSAKASPSVVKANTEVTIPPRTVVTILKKIEFLSKHGVSVTVLHGIMWKWKKVCIHLKSKCYVDRLVKETEENDLLEEAKQNEDLLVQKKQLMEQEKAAQKLREDEFGSCVSKMVYVLLEDKFKGAVADTILKVTLGAQKRRVGKILGCPDLPTVSPPKKKRSPPMKSDIEEPVGSPAENTRSHFQTSRSIP